MEKLISLHLSHSLHALFFVLLFVHHDTMMSFLLGRSNLRILKPPPIVQKCSLLCPESSTGGPVKMNYSKGG
jgi:hypothetical protein